MKKLFNKIKAAIKSVIDGAADLGGCVNRDMGFRSLTGGSATCLAALLGAAALLTPSRCEAQIGTYVVPRMTQIYYGTLSTNTTSVTVYATNLLNYSGFHRAGFWLSLMNTNAAGTYGTVSVQVNPIPTFNAGNASYTNAVFGTNQTQYSPTGSFIVPTNGPTIFSLAVAASQTNLLNTNLDWPLADSIAGFRVTVTYPFTNALPVPFQLDFAIAP